MKILLIILSYAALFSAVLSRRGYRGRGKDAGDSSSTVPSGPAPLSPVPLSPVPSRPAPSRVLIIGASGGTGRQIVTQALERGYSITALVRDRSRLPVEHPRLTVRVGDVLDPASIEVAMQGQEAVLCALGHRNYYSLRRVLSEGIRNILQAMEKHRVPRMVCETSLGIGDSTGRLGLYYTFFIIPVILPVYFWDKARQEELIAASASEWVIVRPGMLTNGERRGNLRHGVRIGNFLFPVRVSRADVAEFMLDQLASDRYLRRAAGVAG